MGKGNESQQEKKEERSTCHLILPFSMCLLFPLLQYVL